MGSASSSASFSCTATPRLHVDGAAAPEVALAVDGLEAGRQVVVDRHGVEVPGDHDAPLAAEVRARDHGVAVADHLEVRGIRERLDDEVGEQGLVARDARHVADRLRDRDRVGGEVEHGPGRGGSRHASSLRTRVGAPGKPCRRASRMPRAASRRYAGVMPATTDTASSLPAHRLGPRPRDGRRRRHRARHLVSRARARARPAPASAARRPSSSRSPGPTSAAP